MEQEIGQYRHHDILKELPESLRAGKHDFDVYYALQAHKSSGQDLTMFQIDPKLGTNAGWRFDKYKFAPD
jgi:hypothetical protein